LSVIFIGFLVSKLYSKCKYFSTTFPLNKKLLQMLHGAVFSKRVPLAAGGIILTKKILPKNLTENFLSKGSFESHKEERSRDEYH
jgi:hypothetical protein